MNEMALLIFTLAEQTAVGAFAALVIMHLMGKNEASVRFKIGIVTFVVVFVGIIASVFHLGQPLRALNVLAGLGSSWLSREILFIGLFALCVLVYAIFVKLDKDQLAKIIGIVGIVCGIAAVVATSLVYMLPGVPVWDSFTTPLQFFLTAIVCGIPLYGALVATFDGSRNKRAMMTWWIIFIVLLITQVVMRCMFFNNITLLIDVVESRIG